MTDTKDKKISYSAWNKYHTCPRLYKLHYIDRIRPEGTSSSLLFGCAIDEALNALLLKTGDPLVVFRDNFTWDMCQDTQWHDNDLDWDLFTPDQVTQLKKRTHEYAAWACMRIKGRLIIESYIENFYPDIEEVHSVQLQTKSRPGFIDAVLTHKQYGKILVDHKTAARPYKRDSVGESSQLALYAREIGIGKAAYVVLVKQIRKNKCKICTKCSGDSSGSSHKTCPKLINGTRCHGELDVTMRPEAICQVIVDQITDFSKEMINTSMNETEGAIKAGHFPTNMSQCNSMYGKRCPMYDHCRGGSMKGLIKKEKDK